MKRFLGLVYLGWLVAAAPATAALVTRAVAYEHDGVKLAGHLVYDDAVAGDGKRAPGVLVVPEWWGLNAFAKERAEAVARLGYVAFAIDMYGAGVVTDDPAEAGRLAGQFYGKPLMAERARAGLDALLATGLVDAERVASIGFCFGGAVSQALAYADAPLAGIVSFHGSLIPPPEGAATGAKFLILHGAVDPFIKPEEIPAFMTGLETAGIDYQFVNYAGAIHAFTNPTADRVAAATGLTGIGYNEPAARRSFAHMRLFFEELFGTR